MYELIQAAGNSFYIQSPAKIGLYVCQDGSVCLIDSGGDKDAGRKVRQLLDGHGWRLRAIYNTHSHADHIGGNAYLQKQTNCAVFAPEGEISFVRRPILEPSLLYGGFPPDELRHKFLLAQPSRAESLSPDCLPEGFELIPLPGHSPDMMGFRTPDGAVFLADCLSSRETLSKYGLCYVYDVQSYLDTLERVKTLDANIFIPSHAEACESVAQLAQYNIDMTLSSAERLLSLCEQPSDFETILAGTFDSFGLAVSWEQYALIGSTLRAYLTYLRAQGRIEAELRGAQMIWHKV